MRNLLINMLQQQLLLIDLKVYRTLTGSRVVLRQTCWTDTFECADSVDALGLFIAWLCDPTLVDVVKTVLPLETGLTSSTSACLVAWSLIVTTVAVTKTVPAPRATGAGCRVNTIYAETNMNTRHFRND